MPHIVIRVALALLHILFSAYCFAHLAYLMIWFLEGLFMLR